VRRNSRRLAVAFVVAVFVLVFVLAGCSGDRPTKAAFVEHMTSVSSTDRSPQWQAIWGCAYAKITSDDTLEQLMALNPGERPAKDLSAQVSNAVVQCIPSQHPTTTTALPATTSVPATTALGSSTGATTSTSAPR
jgi:hypothetical protein